MTDKEATKRLNSLTDEQKYNIINQKIESGEINLKLNVGHYNKHVKDSKNYIENKSYLTVSKEEAQAIIDDYHCTGTIHFGVHNKVWQIKEVVETDKNLGVTVRINGDGSTKEHKTNRCTIHYAKKGTHIVPARRENID